MLVRMFRLTRWIKFIRNFS